MTPPAMTLADRLFASFDRIHILNLPARTDRRAEIAGELRRIGTSLDDPRIRLFPAIAPEDAEGFPSIGARGCFLSHLAILREARDAGLARILILEDDCDFAGGIDRILPRALDTLDREGFGIFYGGYQSLPAAGGGPLAAIAPSTQIQTTHCIGFDRDAIAALIPYLEAMLARAPGSPAGGPMHIDGAYNWFRASRADLAAWAAVPPLGHQRPSRSDIAPPGPIDRLPGPLRHMARQLRRRLKQ